MARITASALITDIRGKLGGSVFQRGAAGLVVRNKATPVNRKSTRQENSRLIQNRVLNAWVSLTDAQRASWDAFSQFKRINQKNSQSLFINGQQYYLKANYYRLFVGLALLNDPVFDQPGSPPADVISFTNAASVLTVLSDEITADEFLFLFVTANVSESLNSPGNRLRALEFLSADDDDTNVITTPYTDIFGAVPVVGAQIFAKWTNIDRTTGYLYPFQQRKFTIL